MSITKIYLVENCFGDPNKVYIGKTKNCRELPHKVTYGDQIIYNHIDEINSLDYKDWEPLESYWIEQFRQWGFEVMNYNKKGGNGVEFHTQETKNKMSLAKINCVRSIEHCNNISNAIIKNPPIIQIDLQDNVIRIWKSIGQIHRETGINQANIWMICKGRGRAKTAGGYKWKYSI